MNFLGIDLGGTTVKYGLVDLSGNVSQKNDFPTKSNNADELLDKISQIIILFKEKYAIKGVGISCPGVIDPYEGSVQWSGTTMPEGWSSAKIKKYLQDKTGVTISVDNDVNCAALGEKWVGAAINYHTFICIAIGTGIGSGIVINDQLYYGAGYQAGEIGYIHANQGCSYFWEKEASTLNFVKRVKEIIAIDHQDQDILEQINGEWIFEQVQKDKKIAHIVNQWLDSLAKGIADAVCILNPQAVILGGGISGQGQYFIDLIKPKVFSYLPTGFKVALEIAKAGNDAAKIGAVKKLMDELA
ncbi:MAG: ROK family protein [Brevinema sp.]